MYKYFSKTFLSFVFTVMLAVPVGADSPQHDNLSRQADNFPLLLDQSRYDEAWQEMSVLFQSLNEQSRWKNRQETIRSAYGALSSRQLHRVSYHDCYSLSPDGQYVIVQYKSSYQNRADTTETVVLDCRAAPECSIREYIIR